MQPDVELDLPFEIGLILLIAKILAGAATLVTLAAIVNVWRRDAFPDVSYGGIDLSQRRLRWLWFGLLVGSFALGAAEDPVANRTQTMEDEEAMAAAESIHRTNLSVPFPFYRFDRERQYDEGALIAKNVSESVSIPWALFSGLLAYLLLVVRWNPENRWALRILRGRKRRWFRRRVREGAEAAEEADR